MSTLAERYTTELATFTQTLPIYVRSVSVEGSNFLLLRLKFGKPFDEVLVHFDDSYRTHYPNGNITFVINGYMKGMPAAASPTFGRICSTLASLAQTQGQEGNDILSLFPITQEEEQKYIEKKERENNNNNTSNSMMMGARSFSTGAAGGGGMMASHRSASMMGYGGGADRSRWMPEPTMEIDVSLEAVKLNEKLTGDINQLSMFLSKTTGQEPIIDVQNLEAGHVAVSYSITPYQLYNVTKANQNLSNNTPSSSNPATNNEQQRLRDFNKMLDSLEMNRDEIFTWRITIDPVTYPQGFNKIEFGQAANFAKGVFPGAVGHLRRILSSFIRTFQRVSSKDVDENVLQLLLDGYTEEEAVSALKNCLNQLDKARARLEAENGQISSATSSSMKQQQTNQAIKARQAKKLTSPDQEGLFLGCLNTIVRRLDSLPEFCCICDQTHVFAAGTTGMAGSTVCTRGSCQFRFSKLDVAKDVATQSAMQTGVMDLLIVIARFAAISNRWELLLEPFPTLVDDKGTTVCSGTNKNIEVCRTILKEFPVMKYLSQSESQGAVAERLRRHHPLAQSMMNWILGSNRAVLIKLTPQQNMTMFGSRHQFRLIMQSPEREKKFQELKSKHGAKWCFHGSKPDCWYSILRNGLKNASNTKYMTSAAAYGAGIYLSPHASTSYSYSNVPSGTNDSKMVAHMNEEFIDPERDFKCVAICEVVNHELKIGSQSIWVMPHEDHVVTRFLIVFTHGHSAGYNVKVDQAANIYILNETLAMTEM